MVVFGQGCYICAEVVVVVVVGQKWLYSGKSGCIRKCGCIWAKVVIFLQNVFFRPKLLYSNKSGCIRAKWLYLGKSNSIRAKVVVFWQVVVLGQKWS